VREVLSVEPEPQWGSYPDRAWDTATWVADNTRIRRALGWTPQFTLMAGLRAFVDWFGDHPEYVRRYRETAGILPR
jgi:nucleoside-diphosphate-sugar epimerase